MTLAFLELTGGTKDSSSADESKAVIKQVDAFVVVRTLLFR